MGFNVSTFRSNGLQFQGARPTLFDITLTPPAGIGSGASNISEKLSLNAKSSQIPSMSIDEIQLGYFGRKIKVPGDRPTFPDWTITVLNDQDFVLRSMFEKWSNQMNSLVSNINSFGQNQNYKVDATVNQYGTSGPDGSAGIIRSYDMIGIWPKTIGAINLDWDHTNTIETFDVTFAVDWWEPNAFGKGENYDVEATGTTA